MSSESQAAPLSPQLASPRFSRYRSVRRALGINPTSSSTAPPHLETTSRDASSHTRLPTRYHRKTKTADLPIQLVADQRARPAPPLHSHSASLAALTGEPHPISTLNDGQDTPSKTVSKQDASPSFFARIKSLPKHSQQPNGCPAMVSEKVQWPPSGIASISADSPFASFKKETVEVVRERFSAEDERMRRIKAKQDAAREFESSKRVASAGRTCPDSLDLKNAGEAGMVDTSTLQGRGPIMTPKLGRPEQRRAQDGAQTAPPYNIQKVPSDRNEVGGKGQEIYTAEVSSPAVRNFPSPPKFPHPAQTSSPPLNYRSNNPSKTTPARPNLTLSKSVEHDPVTSAIPRSAVNAGGRRVVVKYNESVLSLPITPTTTPRDLLISASKSTSSPFRPQQSVLWESFTQLGLERPLRQYEHVRDVMNSWDHDTQNHLIVTVTSANALSKSDLDPKALPTQPVGTSLYMYYSQRPGKWDKRWVSLKQDGQICISKREGGSESSSICRLSDFDIYKPTQRQMKKLRPPRKVCYAIKSQQKSAMFLNGANFVHFFATTDGPLTETWYGAVRTWRSWYLVNVLGEGQELGSGEIPRKPSSGTPRMAAPGRRGSDQTHSRDLCEMSSRGRSAPPSSFPNHQIQQPDALIAASCSRRTPSLIRGDQRTGSIRSNVEANSSPRRSTSLSRGESIHQRPKPLVDLTPRFQEQPQHLRKGRGIAPVPGKALVELATDLEALPGAIILPVARAWQRPEDTGLGAKGDDAATVRTAAGFAGPLDDEMAFTGTGLLGRTKSKRAQGGIGHGYGVKTGDRNNTGRPLVDLKIESQFVDGSLLRQVEAYQGEDERGLVVDRAKRRETDVRVGEGV